MSLINFEEITYELDEYEIKNLLPLVICGINTKNGKDKAITGSKIIQKLKERNLKINGARLRKIIQYIRLNNLVFHLVSSKKGYYVATTAEEILNYMLSLRQRIQSMTATYDAMEYQYAQTTK